MPADEDDRYEAGLKIHYAFNDFIAFNITHMNREELILNPEMWKYLSDEQIMEFSPRIVQMIEPQKLMEQNEWMLRAISAKEALMMLEGARKALPLPAYTELLKLAETNLSPDRWAFIRSNLI